MTRIHPEFDRNGYPTEATLEKIANWEHTDIPGLIGYIREAWDPTGCFKEDREYFELTTGGWSGNENIIAALARNILFWNLCWQSSHRGGLYCFKLPATLDHVKLLADDLLNESYNPEDLDELVHDTASRMASTINNSGIEEQLRFLMGQGYTRATILDYLVPGGKDV